LYINASKCAFFVDEVEYLGFLIGKDGMRMDPGRVTTITAWPIPKNLKDLQVFLGFVNFYRRFIEVYSHITRPLHAMLKGAEKGKQTKKMQWLWGEEQEEAFKWLKEAFTAAPVLTHYDPLRQLLIETDASGFAAGAILSQLEQDAQWRPIAYWSRQCTPAETNYSTHDQELLAIVEALRQWRHYPDGAKHPVRVLTDHNNLTGFMKIPRLIGRQARWLTDLSEFDFHIQYRQGKKNLADGPSRRPDYALDNEERKLNSESLIPALLKKLGLLKAPVKDEATQEWIERESRPTRVQEPEERLRTSVLAKERFKYPSAQRDPRVSGETHEGASTGQPPSTPVHPMESSPHRGSKSEPCLRRT
jgi:hypothetical protein